jgi:peroxiredoxin Q/BCP
MSEENKASEPLTAGSTAPDFSLPARSGKTISLHDFASQKDVLIYFYPKDDTPGCTRESCSLRDGWADLTKAGIEVLGISRDDAASHNAFAAKYNLPFELLSDPDHSVHERYGAWGQNPNPAWGVGPLRKSFLVGRDGRIRHVFDKVDTEHHAEQVLRAAGAAAAPKPAAPPAPKPAAPKAAAPKPAAPPAESPAAKPAVAAPPAKPAAPAAEAPAKEPTKKAASTPRRKAARRVRKLAARVKVRRAVRKAVKKVAAKKAAAGRRGKRVARRSARRTVRKIRRAVRKARRTVRRAKRGVRRAARRAKK